MGVMGSEDSFLDLLLTLGILIARFLAQKANLMALLSFFMVMVLHRQILLQCVLS
eukprot:m.69710 g.69710  ORF g.69710 m.69710 type:complete len:55 (-) comp16044_c0_seq1:1098-1262(-)